MKLRVKFQHFAHIFLDGVRRQALAGNSDWAVYVDLTDGNCSVRHSSWDRLNYTEIADFVGVDDTVEMDDVIEWYAKGDFVERASYDMSERLEKSIELEWS